MVVPSIPPPHCNFSAVAAEPETPRPFVVHPHTWHRGSPNGLTAESFGRLGDPWHCCAGGVLQCYSRVFRDIPKDPRRTSGHGRQVPSPELGITPVVAVEPRRAVGAWSTQRRRGEGRRRRGYDRQKVETPDARGQPEHFPPSGRRLGGGHDDVRGPGAETRPKAFPHKPAQHRHFPVRPHRRVGPLDGKHPTKRPPEEGEQREASFRV
mmetsp:Transcript_16978/g.33646  ORF Transcript_16978/g.33646 Transcript_16978/m.33646 type:complete len:209 (+) Transcript_16978:497-1123(+)